MKLFVLVIASLLASVQSRNSCVNWADDGTTTGGSSGGRVIPTQGTSSGGKDNIISQLFRKAANALAATETAKSQILNHVIQAPASIAEGLVGGAANGISTIAQNTGNAASNFANNVQDAFTDTWNSV